MPDISLYSKQLLFKDTKYRHEDPTTKEAC